MNDKVFIPKKLKIGFQDRNDTYTKKLAYVIYHDGKTWRKEKSWDAWRTTYIDADTFNAQKQKAFDNTVKCYTKTWNNDKENYWHSKYSSLDEYLKACHLDHIDNSIQEF